MPRPVQLKGVKELKAKLARLEKQAARKAVRAGARAGTKVLLDALRPHVPVDKGILRREQTSKVMGKGLDVGGIVGADQTKLDNTEGRPSNIDWLVEYGHVTPDGIFVPPSGYVRRTAASAMPAAEKAATARMKEEIEKAL